MTTYCLEQIPADAETEEHDDSPLSDSGDANDINKATEVQLLQKEIVRSFSKQQFHRTESGEWAPVQQKFLMNLKIARIQDLLMRLQQTDKQKTDQMITPSNVSSLVRHLTAHCVRNRMLLWFNASHRAFVQQLSSLAMPMVEAFDVRASAVLIWMYGKIGKSAFKQDLQENPSRMLLTKLVYQLLQQKGFEEMSIHDVVLVINGLANLDCTQLPEVLEKGLPIVKKHLTSMNHDTFTLLVWSYGKLNYSAKDTRFESRIMEQCTRRFNDLSVQQLSSIAWALCRMGASDARSFLMKCIGQVHPALGVFTPLGIARLIDACFLLNHHPGETVLHLLANRFAHFRGNAPPPLYFQALPAFAYFRKFPPEMFEYSFVAMKEKYESLTEVEQMIRVLSAYSIADVLSLSFLDMTITKLLTQSEYEDLPIPLLRELWIGIETHKTHYGNLIKSSVPKRLAALMQRAWMEAEKQKEDHPLAVPIQSALKTMHATANISYVDPAIEIRADLLCLWGDNRIALMILDESCVFFNDRKRLNGHYLWKERMFLKSGYGVGRVAADKWNRLETDSAKHAYLIHVMRSHLTAVERETSREHMQKIQGLYLNTE